VPLLPLAMVRKVPTTLMMMSRSHLDLEKRRLIQKSKTKRMTADVRSMHAKNQFVRFVRLDVRLVGCVSALRVAVMYNRTVSDFLLVSRLDFRRYVSPLFCR